MDSEGQKFDKFFEVAIMLHIRRAVEAGLEELRRKETRKWLEIANNLRKLGPYDRVEKAKDAAEAIANELDEIMGHLKRQLPAVTKSVIETAERHFVQHGLELDNLLRKHPAPPADTAVSESVNELLKRMGMTWKDGDPS